VHRDLGEAGAEDVAVRVRGEVVAELTGLGNDDVTARRTRVVDPLREQRVLAALAPVLGQRGCEAEVADALVDEDTGRSGRLVAVEGEPAVPTSIRCLCDPGRDGIRQAIARRNDAAEVLRLGGADMHEAERCRPPCDRLDAAAEGHPTPAGFEATVGQPPGELRRACLRRHRDVAGHICPHRLQGAIEYGLGGRLVYPEPDDAVHHRAGRRLVGAEDGGAAQLEGAVVEAAVGGERHPVLSIHRRRTIRP